MYLRQARAREADHQAHLLVVMNQAMAGGQGAADLLRGLQDAAQGRR